MLLQVPAVLDADELRQLRAAIAGAAFVDGRVTAGALLHAIKHNEQIAADDALMPDITRCVLAALKRNDAFRLATYPNQLHGLMVARYRPGMAYGLHVDEPLMGVQQVYRSDLSLTLFLSDPGDYDGGELELHTGAGVALSKLAAGELIAYSTGDPHQVRPVTRGERLVVVAWIQSFVRDEGVRAMLWDIAQARTQVLQREGRSDTFELLNKTHANLLRRYAEV
jgi:PKHD-type hydroxylase